VRTNSSRITFFRKYTKGYTGQSKVARRDFVLNFAYQVTLINKIQKVIQTDFKCFTDANECTQFVRGELYFYFDSLISLVNEASQVEIQKIFEFTTELLKLCLRWIEIFPQYK
jgi:hypothetical protein